MRGKAEGAGDSGRTADAHEHVQDTAEQHDQRERMGAATGLLAVVGAVLASWLCPGHLEHAVAALAVSVWKVGDEATRTRLIMKKNVAGPRMETGCMAGTWVSIEAMVQVHALPRLRAAASLRPRHYG